MEAYYSLYPEKKNAETCYCFFDEIQEIPGWEPFVDRLMRTEDCQVFITGSSSKMLSREIATQMRGRSVSWEVFPFSFLEFLDYRGIRFGNDMTSRTRLMVQQAFEDYMACGGFPEVAGLERRLRIRLHQEYFGAIMHRDIVDRYDVAHPRMLAALTRRLVDNTGSMYSVNSLTGFLKSLGFKASKALLSEYLDCLQDAYLLFSVKLHDASAARVNTNPKKIYCVDQGLVRSVSSGLLVNSGHLLENAVFVALRRVWPEIGYFRTPGGREVDFVVQRGPSDMMLVQVCETMNDPATRQRELNALLEAMEQTGVREGTIVTRSESAEVDVRAGRIRVVPAWKFMVEDPLAAS